MSMFLVRSCGKLLGGEERRRRRERERERKRKREIDIKTAPPHSHPSLGTCQTLSSGPRLLGREIEISLIALTVQVSPPNRHAIFDQLHTSLYCGLLWNLGGTVVSANAFRGQG